MDDDFIYDGQTDDQAEYQDDIRLLDLADKKNAEKKWQLSAEWPVLPMNDTAAIHFASGNFQDAAVELAQSRFESALKNGPGSSKTCVLAGRLGMALFGKGDFQGAKTHLKSASVWAERNQGRYGPDATRLATNLACALVKSGEGWDSYDASLILKKVCDSRSRKLGPVHPDTLSACNNLGCALADSGSLAEAVSVLRRTSARCERVLAESHPLRVATAANLEIVTADIGEAGFLGPKPKTRTAKAKYFSGKEDKDEDEKAETLKSGKMEKAKVA
ncbi:MAG: tetratricopeptide repeat protein [Deltaproteobacteria bacterium]|jgi:hypothetical protein|nr:tetratricopeptide repeat protein [Deltaproteobacteria bacterium]